MTGLVKFLLPGGVLDVHYKLQGSDGVSLQGSELDSHLRRLGLDIHECASDVSAGLRIPELSYQTSQAAALRARIFTKRAIPGEEDQLLSAITDRARPIASDVEAYVNKNNIKIIHVRNIMSLPLNLPATKAFYDLAAKRPDIRFIFHYHDLMWEGPAADKYITPYQKINELMDQIIIPDLANVIHVVINPLSARMIWEKRGLRAQVIPDGFDFERRPPSLVNGRIEEEDRAFRKRFGIGEGDLVVGMMTRIAINKNVEAAIQFVRRLEDKLKQSGSLMLGDRRRPFGLSNRVVLLIVQKEDLSDSNAYYDRLTRYASELGVEIKMIGDSVVPDHAANGDGRLLFYQVYPHVDLVVYPSEFENFGNQAVEAVWARRPIVLFEYPVFAEYIKPYLPHYVSLGDHSTLRRSADLDLNIVDGEVIDRAAQETIALLTNPERIERETNENATSLRALSDIGRVSRQFLTLYAQPLN